MKNATPKDSYPVKILLKQLENLIAELVNSFTSRKAYDKRPIEYFVAEFQKTKGKTVQLYEYHFFDEKGLKQIEQDIYTPIETARDVDFSLLLISLDNLKHKLEKKISRDEKIKGVVKGIKKPMRWEDITIIYDGDSIKVKQHDKSLGKYSLLDIGIPKITPRRTGGVARLFLLFFLKDELSKNQLDTLLSSNSDNHKNKSNLSKMLCSAFGTNIDPIKIDSKTKLYSPIFKATYGGDLKLNEYPSGGHFYDSSESLHTDID